MILPRILFLLIGLNYFTNLLSFRSRIARVSLHMSESSKRTWLFSDTRSLEYMPTTSLQVMKVKAQKSAIGFGVLSTLLLTVSSKNARASDDTLPISRSEAEPRVTDVCWLDFREKDSNAVNRVEISLYGEVVPKTVTNFIELCTNRSGSSYVGSEVFRVVSDFSVQVGNVGVPPDVVPSKRSQYGRSSINDGRGFELENFRIPHDYPTAGVVSMMKDKAGRQDSRFFITLKPAASWADDSYVAFGRVTKGLEYILSLEQIPVKKPSNYPVKVIEIVAAGCYDH